MFYNPLLSNYQQLIFNICTFVFTQPVNPTAKDRYYKQLSTLSFAVCFSKRIIYYTIHDLLPLQFLPYRWSSGFCGRQQNFFQVQISDHPG